MKRAAKLPTGIRFITVHGHTYLQANVCVNGEREFHTVPATTPLKALMEWREDTKVALRTGASIPTLDTREPTLAQDVAVYLNMVISMPSLSDRAFHLRQWCSALGHIPRSQITPPMIRRQLEAWLKSGYAPGSVNRRRTALMHLFSTLDGKSARNPVRDVPKYPEGDGELRALSHALIYRILACMEPSKTRARLRVMAWTGWPHKQLAKLKPQHLDLQRRLAFVTARRKGKGTHADWLPLLPPAVAALKDFDTWDCYGPFSKSAMYKSFQLALTKLNAHRARFGRRPIKARPYDLRHSFGVLVAALFKDDQVVQRLLLHSNPLQTQRYIRAARGYRMDEALAHLAHAGALSPVLSRLRLVGETGQNLRKTS